MITNSPFLVRDQRCEARIKHQNVDVDPCRLPSQLINLINNALLSVQETRCPKNKAPASYNIHNKYGSIAEFTRDHHSDQAIKRFVYSTACEHACCFNRPCDGESRRPLVTAQSCTKEEKKMVPKRACGEGFPARVKDNIHNHNS